MDMKKLTLILLLALPFMGFTQDIPVVGLKQLQDIYIKDNDTTYVLNFWATWCVPCVEELPLFEQLNADYKDKKVKVILASMDGEKNMATRLIPYINEKQLKSTIVLFSEPKPNSWIPVFDPEWSGAIPATIVRNGKIGKEEFYEKKFHEGELEEVVKGFL